MAWAAYAASSSAPHRRRSDGWRSAVAARRVSRVALAARRLSETRQEERALRHDYGGSVRMVSVSTNTTDALLLQRGRSEGECSIAPTQREGLAVQRTARANAARFRI